MSEPSVSNFQADARILIDLPLREVWNYLFSRQGLEIWLGTWNLDKWETGITFETDQGLHGEVRVFSSYSHIRLTWKNREWENVSIFQMRTLDLHRRTEIRIHHEGLESLVQKEAMEKHWQQILEKLKASILYN